MTRLKTLIKAAGAVLLFPAVVVWEALLAARPNPVRERMRVLYYHAVPPDAAPSFRRQMRLLARFARVVDAASTGAVRSRRPLFAITFDDAFRSVRDHALPVLAELEMPVTIYAPTGWLGEQPGWRMEDSSPDLSETIMTGAELVRVETPLVAIGSHSVTHPRLSDVGDEDLARELAGSRSTLEEILGRPVQAIAYPYGAYNGRVALASARAGYSFAYTIDPRTVHLADDFLRGRMAVRADDPPLLFLLKASGAWGWPSKLSRPLPAGRRHWIRSDPTDGH